MDFVDDEDERREIEKDFAALDIMSKARFNFERLICAASQSQDEAVLESLRLEKMFEFAQFFFTIDALGLKGPNDASLLADLHNDQLEKLLKDKIALRRRGLTADRVLKAIFTSDTKPRLEQIWRENPGALDQSNLARFLVAQMSSETTRKLVEASAAAGFVNRNQHVFGATVVSSTGVMEKALIQSMREMRLAIRQL
ncbi:MAG TPA: hypothetical protein VGL41_03370 [Roseiarcus sp.]|jgi:hypothetical protein